MTKTCEQVRNRWLLTADDGLSPRRRDALRRHLDGCAACRQWVADSERWLSLGHAATPDLPLRAGIRAVIRTAAGRLHPSTGWRRAWSPFPLPAMAAALLVFAGLAAWRIAQNRALSPTPSPISAVSAVSAPLSAAEKIDVLAGLLEPAAAGGDTATPADRLAADPLIDWILRTQAAETMDYLDHRLAAAAG